MVGVACDEVRADRARLDLLDELPVAIVDEEQQRRILRLEPAREPAMRTRVKSSDERAGLRLMPRAISRAISKRTSRSSTGGATAC